MEPNPYVRFGKFLVVVSGVIGISFLIWNGTKKSASEKTATEKTDDLSANAPPIAISNSVVSPSSGVQGDEADLRAPSAKRIQASYELLKNRYGQDLQPVFSQDGRIVQIRGSIRPDLKGKTGFSTKDPALAKKMASEILQTAKDALGITGRSPVGDPLVQTGDISAQVYFRQLYEGLVVQPHGTITVNLGPSGELLQIDSDYLPGVRVNNWVSMSKDQVLMSIPKFEDGDGRVSAGQLIVWAVPGADAKKAYEFNASGRQVIIDAQTGQVIVTRDRRIQ